MVSESKLFVLKITWTTIETNNNNNPTTQILKDFEKTIFLKLAPWTRSNFNLPFFLSETYVLNEKKINNNGFKNWNIKVFKKEVLTKIHGGGATDIKMKLLEKQKKGKARSKQFGRVEIPQEAFIGVLKISKEK